MLFAQENVAVYWNSLATDVTVGVPLSDDNSLIGGRIQVKVSFDGGKLFKDMGDPSPIDKRDIDDIKLVSIPSKVFEAMNGFNEGGKAQFIATVWDRAGNSVTGTVSDSILTIDETPPVLIDLKNISSNANKSLAMPEDSVTFQMNTNEAIKKPVFEINGEIYENAAGATSSTTALMAVPSSFLGENRAADTNNVWDDSGPTGLDTLLLFAAGTANLLYIILLIVPLLLVIYTYRKIVKINFKNI